MIVHSPFALVVVIPVELLSNVLAAVVNVRYIRMGEVPVQAGGSGILALLTD